METRDRPSWTSNFPSKHIRIKTTTLHYTQNTTTPQLQQQRHLYFTHPRPGKMENSFFSFPISSLEVYNELQVNSLSFLITIIPCLSCKSFSMMYLSLGQERMKLKQDVFSSPQRFEKHSKFILKLSALTRLDFEAQTRG